ncbi:alpha/beta hydrolase [Mycolicibacillus parakoreensis]|uniref:Alpha/beta fold hydrolase n=1 Tax=Mycolicibacillus parakoreensis TaxID=1069221 RepID=A0ABY3U0G2_9MYCO|nr:alpha/beta fold hydrolase [Mycolicibacillus parakoreensis]MCV7317072.1 alpha/beta hydrolase [Mycolicibacillus parakoreensis]ULN51400.1 alpha/beta fold hydrolase [Mycolicibacillus parakoreensis]
MRFLFVHGGFHAAWCWERTIAELEQLGHAGVAVDLPGHGARIDEDATRLAARRDAIVAELAAGDVLVGHSGGGFDATLAANAAPELVGHIVYLSAALPREGRSYTDAMTMGATEADLFDGAAGDMLKHLHFAEDGTMTFADFHGAREYFYHDCDEATARWAFERLGPERTGEVTVAPVSVPDFWAADLPRSFIRCEQDRAYPRWLADEVCRRLGVQPLSIDASHSPFLSRPAELAELLVHATTTRPVGPLIAH